MTIRDDPVLVCNLCGKGFLRMPKGAVDVWPTWGWTEDIKAEGMCLGEIVAADRATQIRNLDNWELSNVQDR